MLFESLISSERFRDRPNLLFLINIDLFRKKLEKSLIKAHFPDYHSREGDENAATQFLANTSGQSTRMSTEKYTYITLLPRITTYSSHDAVGPRYSNLEAIEPAHFVEQDIRCLAQ